MQKTKKFIDFIITQKCTFRCKYCSQSKNQNNEQQHAKKETIDAFLKFLDKIDKEYEITITGGEALLHPIFFQLINEIAKKGFKINLITNLSFSIEKYCKIFSILSDSLNIFDISFHLDEIKNFNEYINKLKILLNLKPKLTQFRFLIPIYNLTDEKEQKINILKNLAKENNIDCEFQQIRFLNKYSKTSEKEKEYIKEQITKSYSHYCYAGSLSAVIYENGECYRCYSSRFLKANYIGNIKDKNFSLLSKPKPCIHNICTCPKPKNYNQILDKKSKFFALYLKYYSLLFLPYYFVKNFNIVKIKLKHFLSK